MEGGNRKIAALSRSGRAEVDSASVYIDPAVMKTRSAYATRREQSISLVAQAAIASFLSPDADERHEATIAKRLDQQDQRPARLERDVSIGVETLALFIRFSLNTPPLPEPAAKAERAYARARYSNFVATLGRRLNEGPTRIRFEIARFDQTSCASAVSFSKISRAAKVDGHRMGLLGRLWPL